MMARPGMVLALAVMATAAVPDEESNLHAVNCGHLLAELGVRLSRFDQCALDHSRPFEVCRQCARAYDSAHKLFSNVLNLRTLQSRRCRGLVLAGEEPLVRVNFEHILYVWKSQGICDECFVPGSLNETEEVSYFFVLRDLLNGCVKENRDSDLACYSCHRHFWNLTEYFNHALQVSTKKSHHLCLDMVDAMNHTRNQWAEQCFRPEPVPIGTIVTLAAIPLFACMVFYFFMRVALGPKDTGVAEPHTLRSALLGRSGESGAAVHERDVNIREAFGTHPSEDNVVR